MSSTTEKQTYNGWSNYETWNCALWIDNEPGSKDYWRERAREIEPIENQYMTVERRKVHALAEELKSQCEEQAAAWMGDQASFFADLFNSALGQVDWIEIAEYLIEGE